MAKHKIQLDALAHGIPAGSTLERVVVVSAYVGAPFFRALRRNFHPREVVLIVDQSVPIAVLDDVRAVAGKRCLQSIRRGVAVGPLMHAKAYLATWHHKDRSRPMHVAVLGSANASANGFGRRGNAESILTTRVYPSKHSTLMRWFEEASSAPAVEAACCRLGDVELRLPKFRVVGVDAVPDFDAWLQRGFLCHRFEPDPSFLKVTLQLDGALPLEQGGLARALGQQNLRPTTGPKTVRFDYLSDEPGQRSRSAPVAWRSRHFLETTIGFWTSEKCYRERGAEFVAPGATARRTLIQRVAGATNYKIQSWVDDLAGRLAVLDESVSEAERAECFRMSGDKIDVAHYAGMARDQIERDRDKASDTSFVDRYCARFGFPSVPSFRDDPEWEQFALSFAESVVHQTHKGRMTSATAMALRDHIDWTEIEDARQLLKVLRKDWYSFAEDIEARLMDGFEGNDDDDDAATSASRSK